MKFAILRNKKLCAIVKAQRGDTNVQVNFQDASFLNLPFKIKENKKIKKKKIN